MGYWIFPNGTYVPAFPGQFYQDRGINGEVNLYRVSENVTTPTGSFCCRVADAINDIHTVCINVSVGK